VKYRKLGQTNIEVSEIGFGTWGLGGTVNGAIAYGPTDDQESKLALRRAYDLGVTFYDTADFYGYGHSERLLGEALKDVRHKIAIATKVGFLDASGAQDFSARHIRQSIESSLERLQTDYIDLYQLHNPTMEALSQDETILPTLHSLQTEGKVRALGVSLRSPDDGPAAITRFGFKAIQVNFNLVDQRALANGLFDLCAREGVGIVVRTPLCFGFLTGAYSTESKFDHADHRSRWSAAQIRHWATAYQLFATALGEGNEGQTRAQIALRFCLSYRSVSTLIPGMLTKTEVEENVVASQLGPLAATELLQIEQIYQNNTFFIEQQRKRAV
jgi:aryl-alcohol dehydrogenase-like predicted oxidoreductase